MVLLAWEGGVSLAPVMKNSNKAHVSGTYFQIFFVSLLILSIYLGCPPRPTLSLCLSFSLATAVKRREMGRVAIFT